MPPMLQREHCHDTLIRHVSGHIECADPGCRTGRMAHVLVVACTELEPGCCEEHGERRSGRPADRRLVTPR